MRVAHGLHVLLTVAAVALALLALRAAGPAERGEPVPFARHTSRLALALLGLLLTGLWLLGFVPALLGRRLLGGEGPGTAAFLALLSLLLSGIRLGWTAHRRERPRLVAGLLIAHLAGSGLLMAAVAAVLRRPIG